MRQLYRRWRSPWPWRASALALGLLALGLAHLLMLRPASAE